MSVCGLSKPELRQLFIEQDCSKDAETCQVIEDDGCISDRKPRRSEVFRTEENSTEGLTQIEKSDIGVLPLFVRFDDACINMFFQLPISPVARYGGQPLGRRSDSFNLIGWI